ncbi:preprotein translocase subunit SecE [Acidaminococcus sp. NSJ-142]|jgi:preprotein translocase subunit SecE|uniref:preprotein translocase subunit SecE n=1 Tax=Acidaminococcus TaxID=904 RepID=UPI000CFA03CD|nr:MULTISPECIES: preprotein translocase subunit SecE [Acidaminococcus]MCD2436173.1 preprotein translocase subunit SecE [Acidaminococcus hominis]MCH4097020.1 preprotein translocase subunit SecE [Acidaminococcus provencensis]RHK01722.1 preprotein translocase subunit SecE [Acidaminococcus sp. AM05-11]
MAASQFTPDIKSSSGVTGFLREVKVEMKKVAWPNKRELMGYTVTVIMSSLFSALLIWAIDAILSVLFRLVMGVQ